MDKQFIDIASLKKDSTFYDSLDLVLTVKSFDLQAIRKRYIASRNNKSGKSGSVERRPPTIGGLVSVSLSNGKITHSEILTRIKEPRGITLDNNRFGFAAENVAYILEEGQPPISLENPWFSYIHTVQFHPKGEKKVLVSSSGFDLIAEIDYHNNQQTFEWLAWENGFNQANDPATGKPVFLTRNADEYASLLAEGKHAYLIANPKTDHLPTAKRAAFINSVSYFGDAPNRLLATFFHEGKVYEIDTNNKASKEIIGGMKNPHGGHAHGQSVVATSTGTGEIIIQTEEAETILSFQNLPGKPEELGELEWLQNAHSHQNLLIAIDSNRTSFVIIDLANNVYDQIGYNPDWAIQDLVIGTLTQSQKKNIAQITSPI